MNKSTQSVKHRKNLKNEQIHAALGQKIAILGKNSR